MKKFLSILLALPLLTAFTSCHDDDNLPQVDINVTYASPVVDHAVYVVKPDTLKVERVNVVATRPGHVATNGPVSYWFNGVPLGTSFAPPFSIKIPTDNLTTGSYSLTMEMTVLEEGCEMATLTSSVKVCVVDNESEIPEPAGGETRDMPVEYTIR